MSRVATKDVRSIAVAMLVGSRKRHETDPSSTYFSTLKWHVGTCFLPPGHSTAPWARAPCPRSQPRRPSFVVVARRVDYRMLCISIENRTINTPFGTAVKKDVNRILFTLHASQQKGCGRSPKPMYVVLMTRQTRPAKLQGSIGGRRPSRLAALCR